MFYFIIHEIYESFSDFYYNTKNNSITDRRCNECNNTYDIPCKYNVQNFTHSMFKTCANFV